MGSNIFNDYTEYLATEHWDIVRGKKLRSSMFRCSVCGDKEKEFHVHHNNYENLGNENLNYLVVLCKDCHSLFHNKAE